MRSFFEITGSSLRLAGGELLKNKLRTFLSLFGVTIGIFCIISVLATVNSLEHNIQKEISSLGSNTIFIDKWDYGAGAGGSNFPWWKYVNRPVPKRSEADEISKRAATAAHVAYVLNQQQSAEVKDQVLSNVILYGITSGFHRIQPVEMSAGRLLNEAEFNSGVNSVVIGQEIAAKLFGDAARAMGRELTTKGRKLRVVGVIKKQGSTIIGGWQFDKSILLPYQLARTIMDEKRADPIILVKGKEGVSSKVVKDELRMIMRAMHRLRPAEDDDFALNDINDFSDVMSSAFVSINIGGWAIGALAFIVGIFGVANIMFVTVKERTAQIGLKKAIGAKRSVILAEFLMESAFLCIIGGIIGLLLVFAMTRIVTASFDFPIFLSAGIIATAIGICLLAGILAGIIPAAQAARMDPVAAIRSK